MSSLVTIRGQYIMVHDRDLAREFLGPLQAAHVSNATAHHITVQSPPGEGWRTIAANRKKHDNERLCNQELNAWTIGTLEDEKLDMGTFGTE